MTLSRLILPAAFLALGAMWGSSFFWIHISIGELDPTIALAYRMSIGTVLMLLYLGLVRRRRVVISRKQIVPFAVLGLINAALPNFLIAWAELHIDTATAAVLNSLAPIFTLVIATSVVRVEQIGYAQVVGIAIGFAGAVVLASRELGLSGSSTSLLGAAAVAGAALSYAAGNAYTMQQVAGADRHVVAAGTLVFASLFSWLFAAAVPDAIAIPRELDTIVSLAWLGVFSSFLAYLTYFFLIKQLGATRTSTVAYLFPVVGIGLGVLLLGEQPDFRLFGGAVLVLAGLAIGTGISRRRPRPQPA